MAKGKGKGKKRSKRPWWKPRRSRAPQRWAMFIVLGALTAAGVAAHGAYRYYQEYPDRPGAGSAEEIVVEVPRGASFPRILNLLVENGVIAEDDAGTFKLFVLDEGAANRVTAGKHVFRGNMTPTEILTELQRRQKAEEVRVTVPEGRNLLQVAEILASKGFGTQEEFLTLMRDREFLKKLNITGPSAEGYLYPDTYRFRRETPPEDVVERLVRRHEQVYDELRRNYRSSARKLEKEFSWGHDEIVTLASIIEKETGSGPERPHIASVFLNRLRFKNFTPKRLETDPTIIYGCTVPIEKSEACQQFEGRIRRIHLRDPDNPYNTYTHEGLPPGPISNPGRAAMEAVLNPRKSRDLFFVARNDGTHHFSATRAEHERAVDKYIRGGAVGDGVPQ